MTKFEQWKPRPARFVAMTGHTLAQFDLLFPFFKEEHDAYFSRYYLNGKPRSGQRSFTIYCNSPLPTVEERLTFVLSYLKLNPLQEQHADTFGITQKQCNQFFHALEPVLDRALENYGAMPATDNAALQKLFEEKGDELVPDKKILHDGVEREIPRPIDRDAQKDNYSGKKKRHTVKNAVITNMVGSILFLGVTSRGKMHDKKMADTYYSIPAGFELWQDTGYQGYRPEGVTIKQPQKKPRGKELTQEQKARNKELSSVRVRVEHFIGSAKRMKIVREECRLRKNQFVESVMLTCVGLHNLRVMNKAFNYPDLN